MGAWSHEAFGNDTALDWAAALDEVDDLSRVETAIAAIVDAPGAEIDASQACEALAAAEVVACLHGHPGDSPDSVTDWAARTRLTPSPAQVQRVLQALDRIGGDESELKQLWDESDSADDWQASLVDLRQRLLAPVRPLPAPLDGIAKVVRRVARMSFTVPDLPPEAMARGPLASVAKSQLFKAIVAAEVLGPWSTRRPRPRSSGIWPCARPRPGRPKASWMWRWQCWSRGGRRRRRSPLAPSTRA
jgi:Domain of unknown function (DUF4259)